MKTHDQNLINQVFYLADHGYGRRKIADRLNISCFLVRKLLQKRKQSEPNKAMARDGKLAAFEEIISKKVEQELTTTRILREIRELGYSGGRTILGELVTKIRNDKGMVKKARIKRRFETEPGLEMQVDWSPYRVEINGQMVKIHVLGVISCYSRKLFCAAFRNERQSTLLEGLKMAFDYFSGCAIRLVVDNMATAVVGRRGKGRRIIWNDAFNDFSRYYGFTPFACAVRDPDRKGKKEKSFRLLEDDFIKGSSFASWDDLNRRMMRWLDETSRVGNNRVHGTTGKVPNEEHLYEKELFIRPPTESFPVYRQETRLVDRDATISIEQVRYTIPAQYGGQSVMVRLYSRHFEVLSRQGVIIFTANYLDKTQSSQKLVINQTHYANLPRKPRGEEGGYGLERDFIQRFPMLAELIDGIKLRFKSLASIHLNSLIRLADQYGDQAVAEAGVFASKHKRFAATSVKNILERWYPENAGRLIPHSSGLGAILLGEVEESNLEEFSSLDACESEDDANENGKNDDNK